MKKYLPNCITMVRILGTISLLFISPFTAAFYVVYTICGLSDVIDGWVARTMKTTSEFGARLDSIADLSFYSVMLLKIFPVLWERLPKELWYAVGFVLFIRFVSYGLVALKYRRFAALHTYGNKVTGAGIFAIPYFLDFKYGVTYCIVVCVISAVSSLEELLIHICSKSYQKGVKTIFQMNSRVCSVSQK